MSKFSGVPLNTVPANAVVVLVAYLSVWLYCLKFLKDLHNKDQWKLMSTIMNTVGQHFSTI